MQTTISDVIVNIQPKDIQISKEYQASQNIQTSTLSFEQLLNEARGISSSENIQNDSSNAEQTKSTNYKSEEKEAEKVSEKEVAEEPVKENKNLAEKEINEEKISENTVDADSVKTRNQNQKKVKASEDEVDLLKENSKNIDFEMYELQAAEQSAALESQLKAKVRATVENAEQGEITIETDFSDMKIGSKAENLISGKEVKEFALDKDGKIKVTDERAEIPVNTKNDKVPKLNVDVKYNNSNTATMTMDYAQTNLAENNLLSMNNQTAGADNSNFQAMLNNQIQQNVPEFVKTGSIVLKDNNQGTINIVLHPDDLGNVKIHLSLDGKTISGHIVVATKEAMEVFKDNAQTLREAFIQNGFDAANFDVSYNGNNQSGANQNFGNEYNGNQFLAKKAYGFDSVDEAINDAFGNEDYSEKKSEYSINIVA